MVLELLQAASEFCQIGQQYYEMKKKHLNAILLFRDNDYYFTIGQDATDCSVILGLETNQLVISMPLTFTFFPANALDTYMPMIVRAGRRLVICEKSICEQSTRQGVDKSSEGRI